MVSTHGSEGAAQPHGALEGLTGTHPQADPRRLGGGKGDPLYAVLATRLA